MVNARTKISDRLHLLMPLPALLLFTVFFIIPLINGIHMSFTDWNGFAKNYHYIGLENFFDFVHDPRAIHDLLVTVMFGLISPCLLCTLGLVYALVLDLNLLGTKLVRTLVYMPAIISPLIIGYIWQLILTSDNGVLQQILHFFHDNSYQDLLGVPKAAIWIIILVNVWQFVGYATVIFLAGLQSVPMELYEAGKMDGAGYFSTLRYITLPLLMPSIQINVVTNLIASLAVFDVIMALTGGGPGYSTESMSVYIYQMSFNGHTGYATAVALMLFLVILLPVAIALRLTRRMYEV